MTWLQSMGNLLTSSELCSKHILLEKELPCVCFPNFLKSSISHICAAPPLVIMVPTSLLIFDPKVHLFSSKSATLRLQLFSVIIDYSIRFALYHSSILSVDLDTFGCTDSRRLLIEVLRKSERILTYSNIGLGFRGQTFLSGSCEHF